MQRQPAGPPRLRGRTTALATVLTEAASPGVLITVQVMLAAWHSATSAGRAAAFGLLAVTFASVIPMSYVVFGARVGRWADHHIPVRRHRMIPMCVGLVSLISGVVVLAGLDAPWYLTTVMIINVVGLAVLTAITAVWKISAHTAMAAATVTMLFFVIGPSAAILVPAPLATGWSRLRLRAHTHRQVVTGAVVGIVINGGLHLLLP